MQRKLALVFLWAEKSMSWQLCVYGTVLFSPVQSSIHWCSSLFNYAPAQVLSNTFNTIQYNTILTQFNNLSFSNSISSPIATKSCRACWLVGSANISNVEEDESLLSPPITQSPSPSSLIDNAAVVLRYLSPKTCWNSLTNCFGSVCKLHSMGSSFLPDRQARRGSRIVCAGWDMMVMISKSSVLVLFCVMYCSWIRRECCTSKSRCWLLELIVLIANNRGGSRRWLIR